jgi:hypothetical protein
MLTSLSRRDPAAHAKDFEQLDAKQAQMIQLLYLSTDNPSQDGL